MPQRDESSLRKVGYGHMMLRGVTYMTRSGPHAVNRSPQPSVALSVLCWRGGREARRRREPSLCRLVLQKPRRSALTESLATVPYNMTRHSCSSPGSPGVLLWFSPYYLPVLLMLTVN
ncbi:unnamed protein product [Boreogadus saida]